VSQEHPTGKAREDLRRNSPLGQTSLFQRSSGVAGVQELQNGGKADCAKTFHLGKDRSQESGANAFLFEVFFVPTCFSAFCNFSETARSAERRVSSQIFTRLPVGVLLNSCNFSETARSAEPASFFSNLHALARWVLLTPVQFYLWGMSFFG
jgi:hypothetical protein